MTITRMERSGGTRSLAVVWSTAISVLSVLSLLALAPASAGAPLDCSGIAPAAGDEVRAVLVTDQLASPLDVTAPPGDTGRLFVVERGGSIRIIDLADDTLLATPFLTVTPISSGGERGLLGLAFHPRYAENGYFFINYTRAGGSTGLESVIARYQVSAGDPNRADATGTVLLTYEQPFSNHNGGQVLFGPNDGYLYVSTGDGGDGGDPGNRSQNPATYLGKILRLDVDVDSPPHYQAPESNPFVGVGNFLPEIWALGLRNPWRIAFDRENGDLYIADVGQDLWEELNYQPGASSGGFNYEWRVREGDHSFSSGTAYAAGTTRQGPVLEYPHSDPNSTFDGRSITGGAVYRGCSMPDLRGTYFFADYTAHWVRSCRVVGGQVTDLRDRTAELNLGAAPDVLDDIVAFGADGRGELYICDFGTKLFRIVSANPVPPLPRTFTRGSINGDDQIDLADAVFGLGHLFRGSPESIDCTDALDTNDDGAADISDAVYLILHLFRGGSVPPAPFPGCGEDPTPDALPCAVSTCV